MQLKPQGAEGDWVVGMPRAPLASDETGVVTARPVERLPACFASAHVDFDPLPVCFANGDGLRSARVCLEVGLGKIIGS